MRLQANRNRPQTLKPVEPTAPKPPIQVDPKPPVSPGDIVDLDWAAVHTAAYRGGAVGLVGAAGGLLPGGGLHPAGALISCSIGASAAALAYGRGEAALPGALIGLASKK